MCEVLIPSEGILIGPKGGSSFRLVGGPITVKHPDWVENREKELLSGRKDGEEILRHTQSGVVTWWRRSSPGESAAGTEEPSQPFFLDGQIVSL